MTERVTLQHTLNKQMAEVTESMTRIRYQLILLGSWLQLNLQAKTVTSEIDGHRYIKRVGTREKFQSVHPHTHI